MRQIKSLTKKALFLVFILGWMVINGAIVFSQTWSQTQKIVAQDRIAFANFGNTVAVYGDFAFVGAPKDNTDASSQNAMDETGSVYIYKKVNNSWTFHQKIIASDRTNYDYFGWSVAVSGDFAVIGSYFSATDATGGNPLNGAGAAYVFKNNGGTWTEVQKIVASDRNVQNYFGYAVDIDGDNIIVGAYQNNYDVNGGAQLSKAGAAYLFVNNGTTWAQVQKIVASDRTLNDNFGKAVSISGKYLVVGAPFEDEDASNANYLAEAGSAYIFKENGGVWSQIKKIVASDRSADANFGNTVDNTSDYVVVGAWKEQMDANGSNPITEAGATYVFANNSDAWSQHNKLVASDRFDVAHFGRSVSISNDKIVIGSEADNYNLIGHSSADSVTVAGSAFIFQLQGNNWQQSQKLIANDRTEWANFGQSVAIFNNDILVGAYRDKFDTNGSNSLNFAGSAYFFGEDCLTDNSVSVNGETITATENGATYQWIDCDNSNTPIVGETSQSFTASVSGNYAVEITKNGCTVTSACTAVNVASIQHKSSNVFTLSPNPTDGVFTITNSNVGDVVVQLYSLLGEMVYSSTKKAGESITININNQRAGIYLVKVNNSIVGKIVKR
jgi:hypothetical protein